MKKKNLTYHEQTEISYTERLRILLKDMPPYVKDYFRSVEGKTSAKTRISYAYDLQVFFNYLLNRNPSLSHKIINDITLEDLNQLTSNDIEEYMEYLKYYTTGISEQKKQPIQHCPESFCSSQFF